MRSRPLPSPPWRAVPPAPLAHDSPSPSRASPCRASSAPPLAAHLAEARDRGRLCVLAGTASGHVEGARGYATEAGAPGPIIIRGGRDETGPRANVLAWAEPLELAVSVVPGADHFFHRKLHLIRRIIESQWKP